MSAFHPIMTPRAVAGWWGKDPASAIDGLASGVSAAYWNFSSNHPIEICGLPDPATHVVCLQTGVFRHATYLDGKLMYRKPTQSGTANLVPAGSTPRSVLETGLACLHLYVPIAFIDSFCRLETGRDKSVELVDPALSIDHQLYRIGEAILGAMNDGGASKLQFEGLTQAFVAQLICRWCADDEAGRRLDSMNASRLARWQIRRVRELLDSRLAEDIPTRDLAAAARLSPYHFSRCFKATTGMAPHRYVIDLRLRKARALLEGTELAISEVAAMVGYHDPSYFARLFRREVGATPLRYRLERRL